MTILNDYSATADKTSEKYNDPNNWTGGAVGVGMYTYPTWLDASDDVLFNLGSGTDKDYKGVKKVIKKAMSCVFAIPAHIMIFLYVLLSGVSRVSLGFCIYVSNLRFKCLKRGISQSFKAPGCFFEDTDSEE
jgi:hypothetical protein